MALFKIAGEIANKLEAVSIQKEREIQDLFEKNLLIILNVYFLTREYSTSSGGRIDTLGIDKTGSPVIIEYKRNQNNNVINQGLSYLRWLLDHKANFEALCKANKISEEVDWTSPRVICVAESYNKYDLDTADFLPVKIELLTYRIYDENILYVGLESQKSVKLSTSKIFEKNTKQKSQEKQLQKDYSIEMHLKSATPDAQKIFYELREKIKGLDENVVEEPKAKYIAYKLTTNFVDLTIQKDSLKLFLNLPSGKLQDVNNLARYLTKPKKGHWGNGDYEIKINKNTNLDSIFELIQQAYNYNK